MENHNQRNDQRLLRSRAAFNKARDIYPIPACNDIQERIKCERSLLYFLMKCFPRAFYLGFCEAHLEYIGEIESIIRNGGKRSIGFPRGMGKSTIAERAIIWGAICGYRQYSLIVCASTRLSKLSFNSIKTELEANETLEALFPEAIYPIKRLAGSNRRAAGQSYKGKLTYVSFGDEIVFASIPSSSASGAVIQCTSTDSGFRGISHTKPNGQRIRPEFILVDDILTDEMAKSPATNAKIEDLIEKGMLQLGGPDMTLSVLFSGTIIEQNDVMDTYLNRDKKPAWRGRKFPLVPSMPINMPLWDEWKDVYYEEQRAGGKGEIAQKFYLDNREKMSEGSKVIWEHRKRAEDVDSLYFAMTKWAEDATSFASEFQLDPQIRYDKAKGNFVPEEKVLACISSDFNRRELVPEYPVVVGIDINKNALSFVVSQITASEMRVIDYGAFPEQNSLHFKWSDIQMTIERMFVANTLSDSIEQCLDALVAQLVKRYSPRFILIDKNWAESAKAVDAVCHRYSTNKDVNILPATGYFVRVTSAPISEWKKKKGETMFEGGRIGAQQGDFKFKKSVLFDPNCIKSAVFRMWDKAQIKLFNGNQAQHRMFSEHVAAEYFATVTSAVRTTDEWQKRIGYVDEHLNDCLIMCAVAKNILNRTLKAVAKKEEKPAQQSYAPRVSRVKKF